VEPALGGGAVGRKGEIFDEVAEYSNLLYSLGIAVMLA
jgi:hypothetical protein